MKRRWGTYKVLFESQHLKVKVITVNPFSQTSIQRHFYRSEIWFIIRGQIEENPFSGFSFANVRIELVPRGQWHQLRNVGRSTLELIEIQFGDFCKESDIERKSNG